MKVCKKCLLPETYETIEFAEDYSSCNICNLSDEKAQNTDWAKKKKMLDEIIEKHRGKSEYDCIIPFSGGKDSTFTLYYLVTEYQVKPLVVRFDSGFMRPTQANNITKAIKRLGVDYISFTPNWRVAREAMRIAFEEKTDFCWHCHLGIYAYPLRIAVKYNTPLVFWGESLDLMLGGYDFDNDSIDFEDEKRFNEVRTIGITADAMYEKLTKKGFKIDKRDLIPYTYPTSEELKKLQYFSCCLGSFIPWDYRANTKLIQEKLGFEVGGEEGVPFEVNQEGAKMECWLQASRDYIKFLKRGYGRVTQCVNFEIRNGRMTTEEGQKIINKYEGRKPYSLPVLLEYLNMTEDEFNKTVAKQVVEPWVPNFNLPLADKPEDFDTWYRENEELQTSHI
jgi:N-acetyl sugar amidotransferase